MSVFEVTTRISHKWLERKSKHELVSIILANIDQINLFANARIDFPGETVLSEAATEMYAALKAYEVLENHRLHCPECEDSQERAPEACGMCFPYADDLRCKVRAVLIKIEGKTASSVPQDAPAGMAGGKEADG